MANCTTKYDLPVLYSVRLITFTPMETQRQHKFSRQILKDLADIFQRHIQDSFKGAFVTITDVTISPDLSIANVYVSVFPVAQSDTVMQIIEQHTKRIRGLLGNAIGKQARIVPALRFFLDTTEERAAHMDRLLDNLDIPKNEEEPED